MSPLEVDTTGVAYHDAGQDDVQGVEERVAATEAVIDEVLPTPETIHSNRKHFSALSRVSPGAVTTLQTLTHPIPSSPSNR